MSGSDAGAVTPAATVVVMRDAAGGGAPELLMVERSQAMAFAGGALVFPGGRVDPGDHVLAAAMGGEDESAWRIAAIRETIEEAGVALGVVPAPDAAALAAIRAGLRDGLALGEALGGARLDLSALVPFARWLPRGVHHRLFDTRFYLAAMPAGAPPPAVDETENSRLMWTTARAVLDDADAGRVSVIFPTRRNLERLAGHTSFAEAAAHARGIPERIVTPWIEARDGVDHLCIPDDLGYPVTAQPIGKVQRG